MKFKLFGFESSGSVQEKARKKKADKKLSRMRKDFPKACVSDKKLNLRRKTSWI